MTSRFAARVAFGAIFIFGALGEGNAHADDGEMQFSLRGFGTVGLAYSGIDDGDYVANLFQGSGTGRSHSIDAGVDSKIGVQLDGKLTNRLSGVFLVVAATRANSSFSQRVEWANLKYSLNPYVSIRAGRTALPNFLVSDARLVNLANP